MVGVSQMLIPKPAAVSSPTSISISSTVRPPRRVMIVRGGDIDMMPTTRLTVMVWGLMEQRNGAFGMRLRSVSKLDESLVLACWVLGAGVAFVSNEMEHSEKLVDSECSQPRSGSVVWAKEASSCTAYECS